MADVSVKVDSGTVRVSLNATAAALVNLPMSAVATYLLESVRRTFSEDGSPAGSWPALAASTLRKKQYRGGGHKLLVLSGTLRSSIRAQVSSKSVTVGTNVPYAAVHQFGSADRRGGSIGSQARITGRAAKNGRHQNIPARPFLVFRPEDPQSIASLFERYLASRLRQAGTVVTG